MTIRCISNTFMHKKRKIYPAREQETTRKIYAFQKENKPCRKEKVNDERTLTSIGLQMRALRMYENKDKEELTIVISRIKQLSIKMDIDELAKQIVSKNHGMHCICSALVRADRAQKPKSRIPRLVDKIEKALNFKTKYSIKDGVKEIKKAFAKGIIQDIQSPKYYNAKFISRRLHNAKH